MVTFEQDLEERKDVILIYIEDPVPDIIASNITCTDGLFCGTNMRGSGV